MLESRVCRTPPTNTGLVQAGNEEIISLSAATFGVQAVMMHASVFPALGGEPCTMDPQLGGGKNTRGGESHGEH